MKGILLFQGVWYVPLSFTGGEKLHPLPLQLVGGRGGVSTERMFLESIQLQTVVTSFVTNETSTHTHAHTHTAVVVAMELFAMMSYYMNQVCMDRVFR